MLYNESDFDFRDDEVNEPNETESNSKIEKPVAKIVVGDIDNTTPEMLITAMDGRAVQKNSR